MELGEETRGAIETHKDYLAEQTLADEVDFGATSGAEYAERGTLGGAEIGIGLTRKP